jgi:hypothetical protein
VGALAYNPDVAIARAKYQQRVIDARTSLQNFIEFAGRSEEGAGIELDHIHKMWCHHLTYCWSRGLHAGILAPFGSGKSSTLAVPLSCYLIGRNPQIRIKLVANHDDYAKRRVGAAKAIMETVEYQQVFPHIVPGEKWTDHELEVARMRGPIDPTLHARGVLTAGVGTRADVEIFDDVCDQLNSEEPGSRRKVKEFVRRTWLSRLDQKAGRALWIATPWDPDDATYDLMHDQKWAFLVQRVAKSHTEYDQEVFNVGDDYTVGLEAILKR